MKEAEGLSKWRDQDRIRVHHVGRDFFLAQASERGKCIESPVPMRNTAPILCLCFLATSCTTTTMEERRFSVRPYGEIERLTKTQPQEGTQRLPKIARQSFRELTIAQGSGLDGFDSIRVFADGSGYAIVGLPSSRDGVQIPLRLSDSQLDRMISAMQRDELHRVLGIYSTDLADGTQGFVEVVTSAGQIYSWLDNYFEPVANTYRFCNAEIWPGIQRSLAASTSQKRKGLQEEYHRIFRE
jgi:hypothetical protein